MAEKKLLAKDCIRPPTGDACVIFIHGIFSGSESAWTAGNGVSWPKLLEDEAEFAAVGIFVFSYRADLNSKTYAIDNAAESLREFIRFHKLLEKRRLVFVAHSLGGIVARRYLVANQVGLIDLNTLIGLMLVASPSLGSDDANTFNAISRLLGNTQLEALQFSEGNTWLNTLDQDFRNLKDSGRLSIVGKELVENEPIPLKKYLLQSDPIVKWFSASRYFADSVTIDYSDHMSICKPIDRAAQQHEVLITFLRQVLNAGPSARARADAEQAQKDKLTAKQAEIDELIALLRSHAREDVSQLDKAVAKLSACSVQQVGELWEASFDLLVPATGDSKFETLGIATGATLGQIQVAIYVARAGSVERETYRVLTVDLAAKELVASDDAVVPPAHTLLKTRHEWTTPPVHAQVLFWKESAVITMMRGAAIKDYSGPEEWSVTATRIGSSIDKVRNALEALREKWSAYFDAIDAGDMAGRLPAHYGALFAEKPEGWQPLPHAADKVHIASFEALQASDEWFVLASTGYALYNACFVQGTRLRAMLDELKPGSRVDFQWTEKYGNGWVPHVPWALMHIRMPDVTRALPVDPEAFLGLRLRLGSQAWSTQNTSRALKSATHTNAMNLLYWGSKAGDDVAVEAKWQAQEFASWGDQSVLPKSDQAELKRQVVFALDEPAPSPVGVVYLYCHCSIDNNDTVVLRFGDSSKPQDVLAETDISSRKLVDAPLLFANACMTAQADPFKTGPLESHFFDRGVRAFIGTETRVPVQLASKFAWLYFQFFYRRFDPEPMSAGEAMTQARMFLWMQYRNVGGLFYSLVNQYDLYFASHDEVVALRQ